MSETAKNPTHSIIAPKSTTSRNIKISAASVKNAGASSDVKDLLPVQIHTTVIDRLAGVTASEPIWRPEVNAAYLGRVLADISVRNRVSSAFMSLEVANIIPKLIALRTVTESDKVVQTFRTMKEVRGIVGEINASLALTEILNSYLIKTGLTPVNTGGYSNLVQYISGPVTVKELAQNVLGTEVFKAVSSLKAVSLANGRYTPEVLGNEIALAMEQVGRVLTDSHEMNSLFDDIVRGVRARIDPRAQGMTGAVSASWRNSSVVTEASHNFVFVSAALALPKGYSLTPQNPDYRLDQYGTAAWAALKSSTRYAFVTLQDVKRSRGLKRVRDRFGIVRSAVLWDSATPDAVAQVVHVNDDARLADTALRVSHEKGNLGAAIKSAYDKVEGMGTDTAVRALVKGLRYHVDASISKRSDAYEGKSFYYFSVGDAAYVSANELAALMSHRVFVKANPEERGLDKNETDILMNSFRYAVETQETELPLLAGTIYNGQLYTNHASDVFLAAEDFDPQATLSKVPQVIPASGLNTSYLGLDAKTRFTRVSTRVSFDVDVNGVKLSGRICASDLDMFTTNDSVSVVKPMFNQDVFACVADIHEELLNITTSAAREAAVWDPIKIHMIDLLATTMLSYSQRLSARFRNSMLDLIEQVATRGLATDDAYVLMGKLESETVKSVASIIAMYVFQRMQGFESANTFLKVVSNSDIMAAVARAVANEENV